MKEKNSEKRLKIKKVVSVISFIVFIAVMLSLTIFFISTFKKFGTAEKFKEYIESFGIWGMLVGFGIQVLQIFIALLPGEAVEIGLGYAFGAVFGTLICYLGIAFASSIVFVFVKKLGLKFVELFFDKDKIENMKFVKNNIGNKERFSKILFLLFFLPGTPKDLLTYIVGLTPINLGEFLFISLVGRFPSVVSSTVGGMLIQNGKYFVAIILFIVTAICSILGYLGYVKHK